VRTASLKPSISAPHTPLREDGQGHDAYDLIPALLNSEEFGHIHTAPRKFYLRGLIAKDTLTIINASRGVGKSLFALHSGNAIAWGGGYSIGPWECEEGGNVLLIDGESQMRLLQARVEALDRGRDTSHKPYIFYVYSESLAHQMMLAQCNLLDAQWRSAMRELMLALEIRVVILDNLASITPGIDENDKKEFDPINQWLMTLRFDGLSVVIVHHTGKSGVQRGTSAHEDHVDTALCLERPRGYRDEWGCRFRVRVTKDRDFIMSGPSPVLQLMTLPDGRQEFVSVAENPMDKAVMMLEEDPDLTVEQAKEAGISRATYFRAKKELEK